VCVCVCVCNFTVTGIYFVMCVVSVAAFGGDSGLLSEIFYWQGI